MGKRGPRKTPTAILKLRGSAWAERRKGIEPTAPQGRPDCPDWLDAAARSCWEQLVPQLMSMAVLTLIDGNALARYCVLWSRWVAAEKFITQYGSTYPLFDDHGKIRCMKQHPQVNITRQLSEQLRRLEAEFGMTPSSRAGLDTSLVPAAQNNLQEFINSKHQVS